MNFFFTETAARVIFVLGIINLVSGVLVLFTCRCIPGLKIFQGKLMQNPAYKWLFKLHCYIWWLFWTSVIIHAIFAISRVGNYF